MRLTANTFSVPDEDDDVIEVVDYKTLSVQQKSSPWSESSDMEYGSDLSRPLDLTSPVTSPEIKVSQLPTKPLNDATVATIQQTTTTTSEAVIPPSSPPYHAASPEMSEHENHSESEEEEGVSESEDSAGEEQNGMFDEDSEDSEDDHYEGSDWGEEAAPDAQAPSFSVFEGDMARPTGGFKIGNEVETSTRYENQAFSQVLNQPTLASETSAMAAPVQPHTSAESSHQGFTWPEYLIPRVPSPSDKAMAKPMDIPAPAVSPCLAPAYQSYNNIAPAIQAWASRNLGSTSSFASNNANESFPFGPHRSSGGYLRHVANEISSGYPLKTRYLADEQPEVKKADKADAPATRVSVSDIVEAHTQNYPTSNNLKRKANDFEADLDDGPQDNGNTQDSITDAQPRPDMQDLELTQSQIPETQPIKEVAPTTEEHRRKRVKSNQAYTFMKYAAVAAVGAAVGSIGTIAGLSSLPADFFN